MVMKEISKEDVPSWEYGNVVIKTFNYGDKLRLVNALKKSLKTIANLDNMTEDEMLANFKDDSDLAELNIDLVLAGVYSVRKKDGLTFEVKPETLKEQRMNFIYNLEFESGKYLLAQIVALNKPASDDEKKESS